MSTRFRRFALAAFGVLALAQTGLADTSPRPDRQRGTNARGPWTASSFERWRGAIENYVSNVKLGNQTQIGAAAVAYATYLNEMHRRIHVLFADWFLASLDSLPPSSPLSDPHLVTIVEIVLARDGHVAKMGVVKRSGVTAFDIGALDAVDRASPFGPPPASILSSDGQVYPTFSISPRPETLYAASMRSRAIAVCSTLAVVVALAACKPKLGGACGTDDATRVICSGPKTALVCAGKHWVDKPCAAWCIHSPDPQSGAETTACDDVTNPAIGDPCFLPPSIHGMPADESACAPDGKAVLTCRLDEGHAGGGFWTIRRTCAAGTKCMADRGHDCLPE